MPPPSLLASLEDVLGREAVVVLLGRLGKSEERIKRGKDLIF